MFQSGNVSGKRTRIVALMFFSMLVILDLVGCQATVIESAAPTSTPELASPTPTVILPTATTVPSTPTPKPTATPVPPTEVPVYREKVDVGGYTLYIRCIGEGNPTVILESTMGSDKTQWNQVLAENPTDMRIRVCVYDRAGKGFSEASPDRPRNIQDMAEGLHKLLTNANITGPFVYVGYWEGASIARMYTDLYPNDVVGMILIGGHPDFVKRLLAILPPETEGENPSITKIRDYYTYMWEDPMKNPETWDLRTSSKQLQAVGPLGNLPLVVLNHDDVNRQATLDLWLGAFGSEMPLDLLNKIEDDRAVQVKELAALSTNSTLINVENSSAYTANTHPESVVDAIRIVVEKVRGE